MLDASSLLRAAASTAALAVLSCSSCHGGLATSDRASGMFVRPDAPDPKACGTDDDCVAGPGVNPDNGCCDTGVERDVFGRGYLGWRAAWVRENCGKIVCPTLPPPAPPLPCSLEGRCVDGRCRTSCLGPEPQPRAAGEAVAPELRNELALFPSAFATTLGVGASGRDWPVRSADVERARRILSGCLSAAEPPDGSSIEDLAAIAAGLGEYRAQLVPFANGEGERCFWANLFRDPTGDRHPSWRTEIVGARGGGTDYFSVVIDLDAERCERLRINAPR